MPPYIEIRDAKVSDLPAIQGIFDSWYPHNWDKNIAAQYYKRFFNKENFCSDDEVIILSIAEKVIGVIGCCPARKEAADICWLGWFYIHKSKIGHSYGQELLHHVIEKLNQKPFRKLYIGTTSNDFYSYARKLYERLGFKLEATLLDYYGNEEDKLIYGLNLIGINKLRY